MRVKVNLELYGTAADWNGGAAAGTLTSPGKAASTSAELKSARVIPGMVLTFGATDSYRERLDVGVGARRDNNGRRPDYR